MTSVRAPSPEVPTLSIETVGSAPESDLDAPMVLPPSGNPTDVSDSESDSESYMSFSSDSEDEDWGTEEERIAREHERQRVLEAAGLIVKSDDRKPPPRPPKHKKSKRTRRVPPAAPSTTRSPIPSSTRQELPVKKLPNVPDEPVEIIEPADRLDDAYERYEAFKQSKAANRLSIASTEALPLQPPTPPAIPLERTTTQDSERQKAHTGFFSSLLGRRTPANDDKRPSLIISGPISGPSSAAPGSAHPDSPNSPGFGTVCSRVAFLSL
jgi:hypothetical protein